jgi:ubiquitin-protein ligase E3 C
LNQLLGKLNSLEDLKNFDREFYNNLVKLRFLSESEIANLGLTFELNVSSNRAVPLIPGGASMPVSKQNVIHYIHLVAHQRLNIEGAAQTKAFLRGFRDLIPASWVRLFSAYELQKLISGDDTVRGIDVANLKESMQYAGGYHPSQQIIHWFWEVIEEFTPDQQRQFLRFMTSCSRQPLLGFRALEPAPCIQQVRLPPDLDEEERKRAPLPSSSTCMNLLKLPNYKDKEILRKKLLDAVEAGAGFELT